MAIFRNFTNRVTIHFIVFLCSCCQQYHKMIFPPHPPPLPRHPPHPPTTPPTPHPSQQFKPFFLQSRAKHEYLLLKNIKMPK